MFRVHGSVGEFELVRVLARSHGSSGMVCLAEHATTGVPAAVKMISRRAADVESLIAAEREGALLQDHLARCSDVVACVYDCDEDDGTFYVAMEYIDGIDLDKQIGNGNALAPLVAARVLADVYQCLEIAHSLSHMVHGAPRAIVHGDISPANIRVTPSGRAKLLDFGSAKAIDGVQRCAFSPHLTVQYASPERLESGMIDVHSDLWAAGLVLYEAIAGRRPWEAIDRQDRAEWPSRSRRNRLPAVCPSTLAHIATRATAPILSDRYPSAVAISAELGSFLYGGSTMSSHLIRPPIADQPHAGQQS